MNILITGGTGFIGHFLVADRLEKGDEITVLSRRQPVAVKKELGSEVRVVSSFQQLGDDVSFDAVVNLAGEGIVDRRWTDSRRKVIRDSRIGLTKSLVEWLKQHHTQPEVLISGSAIGYYGAHPAEDQLDEFASAGHDFSATLCVDWENAAKKVDALGIRLCLLRTGIVLHPSYGALAKMMLPFQLGLGGRMGHGRQMMSWIHIADMIRGINYLLENPSCSGAYNMTAPEPVANADFTRTLAHSLNRKARLPMPELALKLMLGEASSLLLEGQTVLPDKLQRAGFKFEFSRLGVALDDLLCNT
ncbi:TIGR01777 family oxidoreductase [Endozoicomonadaceae bacterium StTr2]